MNTADSIIENAITFDKAIPVLRIFSLEKAREFYLDYLGFSVDWEHRFAENSPVYMQVSRGKLVLHLSEHVGDSTPGSAVLVQTHGLEELHKELQAKHYKYMNPGLETTEWNARMVSVIDPFGNKIRFHQQI